MQKSRIPRYLLDWVPDYSCRDVGHPRTNLMKTLQSNMVLFLREGCDLEIARHYAEDRERWGQLLSTVKHDVTSSEQADLPGSG